MEDQANPSSSSELHSTRTGLDGHSDLQQLDENDELLLLRMTEFNDEPVSPSLKAVMDKGNELNLVEPPKFPTGPLVVERPRSSGVNPADFCFTKPLQYGKNFSFHGPAKQSSTKSASHGGTPVQKTHGSGLISDAQDETAQTDCNSSYPQNEPEDCHSSNQTDRNSQNPEWSNTLPGTGRQGSRSLATGAENVTNSSLSRENLPNYAQRNLSCKSQFVGNGQCGSHELDNSTMHNLENHSKAQTDDRNQTSLPNGKRKSRKKSLPSHPDSSTGVAAESSSAVRHSCGPSNEGFRVVKHRHKRNNRKSVGSGKPSLFPDDTSNCPQLTEDDIFQLFINRIRQREEDEVAAANLREQIEAELLNLKEENKTLRDQLDSSIARLHKKGSEIRSYQTQTERWKAKLSKFKHFLNGFGNDYQGLRDEATHLKLTKASLDNEKHDILDTIVDVRSEVSRIVQSVGDRRGHLTESDNIINSLKQSLNNSEGKTDLVNRQLLDEKRKVAVLESYIQNYTRNQGKHIVSIRDEQREVLKRLDSVFELADKKWETSQVAIQRMICLTLAEFSSSTKDLIEKCSMGELEAQQITGHISSLMARMDSFGRQMTQDIEKNDQLSANIANDLKERVQVVKECLGSNSSLFKQLVTTQQSCGDCHEKFSSIGTNFNNLTVSIEALEEKESDLATQIEDFSNRLTEVQPSKQETAKVKTSTDRSAEVSDIQLQAQGLSAELKLAEQSLETKETENETIKLSLLEAITQSQETETEVSQLKTENSKLRDKLLSVESKVREELNRASVIARDQSKARFEQQVHKLLREKVDIEKDAEKVKEQLEKTKKSLIENGFGAKSVCNESQSLLLAKENEVRSLQDARSDLTARLAAREADIKKYQALEESISNQQITFQEKLYQANERLEKLGNTLPPKDKEAISESCQRLRKSIELLQEQLSKKDVELSSVCEELRAANSAKTNLESGKAKAKTEIHGLLKRVHESERWMKNIKNTLERLGIPTSKEPFKETWNKLESLVRVATRSSSRPTSSAQRNSISTPRASSIRRSNVVDSTPRKSYMSPSQVVQTTKFIYRTQSIRSGGYSSPEREACARIADTDSTVETIPVSQPTTSIVPFSEIQKQLSPDRTRSPNEDLRDITGVLMTTSEDAKHTTPKNGSSCPDKSITETEPVIEEVGDDADAKQTGMKRKAVSFQPREVSVSGEADATVEGFGENDEKRTPRKVLGDRETRQIRRTYSRNRQYGATKDARKNPPNASPPVPNTVDNRVISESPCSRDNKRAKISTTCSSRSQRQTSGVSEYFEPITSPANLASKGKNCPASGSSHLPRRTRSQKRGGRKSRAERYDARFNQETQPAKI